jgi:hypothetical protein
MSSTGNFAFRLLKHWTSRNQRGISSTQGRHLQNIIANAANGRGEHLNAPSLTRFATDIQIPLDKRHSGDSSVGVGSGAPSGIAHSFCTSLKDGVRILHESLQDTGGIDVELTNIR